MNWRHQKENFISQVLMKLFFFWRCQFINQTSQSRNVHNYLYICSKVNKTRYRHTFKSLDDQRLAADISSNPTLTSQRKKKNWLVTFSASKTKLITFYHHWSNSRTTASHNERMSPSEGIVPLREYWASNLHMISSGTLILLKMQVKWSAPCTTWVSPWLLMLSSTFLRTRTGRKWNTVAT